MCRFSCALVGYACLAVVMCGCEQGEERVTSLTPPVAEEQVPQAVVSPEPMLDGMVTAEDSSEMKQEVASRLLNPSTANIKSPVMFHVRFETTKGPFIVQANYDWSPSGAERLYNLVTIGFFTNVAFFRAIDGFMVQFGMSGDPAVSQVWRTARISDDQVRESNKRGYLTFAKAGPNSRTTQMFINTRDNSFLDQDGFSPVGRVVQGMSVVDMLYTGYGDAPPKGDGPKQDRIHGEGNKYLRLAYPKLDYIKSAAIVDLTE